MAHVWQFGLACLKINQCHDLSKSSYSNFRGRSTGFACLPIHLQAGLPVAVPSYFNCRVMTKKTLYFAIMILLVVPVVGRSQILENVYRSSDADLLRVNDSLVNSCILKGATLIHSNALQELLFTINIPQAAFDSSARGKILVTDQFYTFRLRFPVQWNDLLQNPTSNKTFQATGLLSLNGVQKRVELAYIPMPSGTEETGSIDLFLSVKFVPSSFNIQTMPGSTFLLRVSRAYVNNL